MGVDFKLEQLIAREYHDLAEELIKNKDKEDLLNKPVGSAFTDLDDMLGGGFKKGEVAVLSAPTKQGKTTLAQTLSWNMAKQDKRSLWFTMEMSWQEITRKFMMMDEDLQETGQPSYMPIFYPMENFRGKSELTLDWVKQVVWEAKEKQMVEFVVIDHLHFLLPLRDYNTNVSFLIGSIVREIKKMAVEMQIPILLIAHTKKFDVDKTPDINSIRDSSFIAQETDFTMIMWRIRDKGASKKASDDGEYTIVYTNMAWLSLEANRRTGKTGRIKLWFDGSKFVDLETKMREHKEISDLITF